MDTEFNLERKLVSELNELSYAEEKEIKITSSIYIDEYEELKNEKINSFKNSVNDQIRFYGRNPSEYAKEIENLTKKYSELINMIIKEYNTRFIAINNELQDTQSNQKIAIVNIKFGIKFKDDVKIRASENKKDNYEIVLGECSRQLDSCKDEMIQKVNEIFYSKDKQLSLPKTSILEKIKNIFTGKAKVENFLLNSVEVELNQLENSVSTELKNVSEETILNLAIIKDARQQTQEIFNEMLKEQS